MKLFVSIWPEAKTKLLEKFFEEGCSTSLISHRLGEQGYRATKNSVIGKLHRLGLAGNKKSTKDKAAPQRIKKVTISTVPMLHRIAPKLCHKMASPPAPIRGVLLRETKENDCRAIIAYRLPNGELVTTAPNRSSLLADAVCCGKTRIWKMVNGRREHSPWCEEHNKRYINEGNR